MHVLTVQNAPTSVVDLVEGVAQIAPFTEGTLTLPITKEIKSIKNIYVEKDLDAVSVILLVENEQKN